MSESPSLILASTDHLTLKAVLEIGRACLGNFEKEYRVYLDVTPMEVTEPGTIPFAIFTGTENGYAAARLIAQLIAEGWPDRHQTIVLPKEMLAEVKWGAQTYVDEDDPGAEGNTGTKDDSLKPRLLDQSGHVMNA